MLNFIGPLIVVEDIERSKRFYMDILDQKVRFDLGANQQFESGLMLQTKASWFEVSGIDTTGMQTGSKNMELYFETEDFDGMVDRLRQHGLTCVHDVVEYEWGQRGVAVYDPDGYVVDIGESLTSVVRRLYASGLTAGQVADKTELPLEFIQECIAE